MNKKQLLIWSFYLWLGGIWILSSLPAETLPALDALNLDKLSHVFVYGVLSYLAGLNLLAGNFKKTSRHELMMLLVLSASLDEAHQLFCINRSVTVLDFSANLAGIFSGWLVLCKRFVND